MTLDDIISALSGLLSWAPLLRAALPLAALGWGAYALTRWLSKLSERIRQGQGQWREGALRMLPWVRVGLAVAVLWLASRLLTSTGAWLPVVGLVAIALLGFAAGGFTLMRDALMGLVLSVQRPFRIGDHVQVGTAPKRYEGEVRSIGLRSVLLVGSDGTRTYVPNSQIMRQVIINKTPQQGIFPVSVHLTPPPTLTLDAARRLAFSAAWVSRFASPHRPPEVIISPDALPNQPALIVRAFTHTPSLEGALRTDITELFQEGASPLHGLAPAKPRP
jgi:small-conductance mechanosensitive channel